MRILQGFFGALSRKIRLLKRVRFRLVLAKLLLSNGADPNLVYDDGTENVLWMLQYSEEDTQENEIRLNIVKLLLENGADPHLKVEDDDLHDWALAALQDDYGTQFEYRNRFIDLLEAYDFQRDF